MRVVAEANFDVSAPHFVVGMCGGDSVHGVSRDQVWVALSGVFGLKS